MTFLFQLLTIAFLSLLMTGNVNADDFELPTRNILEIRPLDQVCTEAGILAQLKDASDNPEKYSKLFPAEGAELPTEFDFSKMPTRFYVTFYPIEEDGYFDEATVRQLRREAAFKVDNSRVFLDEFDMGNLQEVLAPLCFDEVRGDGIFSQQRRLMAEAFEEANFPGMLDDMELNDGLIEFPNSIEMTPIPDNPL